MERFELRTSEWGRRVKDWSEGRVAFETVGGISGARLFDAKTQRKCCLGCVLEQAGVARESMRGKSTPCGLDLPASLEWLDRGEDRDDAMIINDTPRLPTKRKHAELAKIFAKHGIELVLIEDEGRAA